MQTAYSKQISRQSFMPARFTGKGPSTIARPLRNSIYEIARYVLSVVRNAGFVTSNSASWTPASHSVETPNPARRLNSTPMRAQRASLGGHAHDLPPEALSFARNQKGTVIPIGRLIFATRN